MILGLMTLMGLTGIGAVIGNGFTCLRDFGTSFIMSGNFTSCCVSAGFGAGGTVSVTGGATGILIPFFAPPAKPATGLTIASVTINAN
jgi:hypothetical protein